jgi:hypothetical protein
MKPWKWPTGTSRQVPRTDVCPAPGSADIYISIRLYSLCIYTCIYALYDIWISRSLSLYIYVPRSTTSAKKKDGTENPHISIREQKFRPKQKKQSGMKSVRWCLIFPWGLKLVVSDKRAFFWLNPQWSHIVQPLQRAGLSIAAVIHLHA